MSLVKYKFTDKILGVGSFLVGAKTVKLKDLTDAQAELMVKEGSPYVVAVDSVDVDKKPPKL